MKCPKHPEVEMGPVCGVPVCGACYAEAMKAEWVPQKNHPGKGRISWMMGEHGLVWLLGGKEVAE